MSEHTVGKDAGFETFTRGRSDVAERNRQRRKPRGPLGNCPVCNASLPDVPPSQRRQFCSIECAGVAKRTRVTSPEVGAS